VGHPGRPGARPLFIGYEPTFVGSVSGAVWAFVDFFVAGVVFAWIYNRLLRRHIAS